MEIYIEKIVIINVFIHILLVLCVVYLTNNKINIRNLIISIVIGIINMYFYFLFNYELLSIIIVLINSLYLFRYIKSTLLYLMFNFILGGVTGIINLSITYYYEVILLCSIFILIIMFFLKKNHKIIKIVINDKYTLNCFYDTGCLINVGMTPVIVVSNKYDFNLELFTNIKINTVSGVSIHNVYKARNIYLLDKGKKVNKYCLIMYSNIEYDVIVGKNFIGGI